MMKTVLGIAISVLALISSTGVNAQTVEDELRHLLETHPQLRAARNKQLARQETIGEARSNFLPQVELLGDVGRENIDKPAVASTDLTRKSARLRLTQSLFSGFRNPGNLNIAKIDELLANHNLTSVTQLLLFRGYEVYIDVLATQELRGLAGENTSNIQTQLTLEDERVRRGAGASIDVLFAKSRLQVAKENQVFFRGRFEDALVRFQRIFGRPARLSEMVLPAMPDSLIPATLEEALVTARENNPVLQIAEALIDRASEQETIARADFLPGLNFVAESNYEDDFDGTKGLRRDYFVGLRARWTLFSGFGTQSAVAAAKQNKFAVRDEALDARRGVEEDVGRAWENMATANERVELLDNAVEIAGEVFDTRRRLREQGRDTEVNVLDAQQEFFRAQIQLVEAQFVARVARFRVLQALGTLTPEKMEL